MASEVSCRVRVIGSPYEKDKDDYYKNVNYMYTFYLSFSISPKIGSSVPRFKRIQPFIRNYIVDCLLMSIIVDGYIRVHFQFIYFFVIITFLGHIFNIEKDNIHSP